MRKEIIIKTFDKFSMTYAGITLTCDDLKSKQLTKLLLFLISRSDKACSTYQIFEVLWKDEEISDPSHTLKNLVYRLRKIFREIWGEEVDDLIVSSKGSYEFNSDFIFKKDCDEFSDYINNHIDLNSLLSALNIYKGEYLKEISEEIWVIIESAHYNSMYIDTVKKVCQLLEEGQNYKLMEQISQKANIVSSLDEQICAYYVKSLMLQGKYNDALKQYNNSIKAIYSDLGISKPESLMKVYEMLLSQTNQYVDNITDIKSQMKDTLIKEGSFFTEYGVFKQIYQLEIRKAERMGISVYVALITLTYTYPQNKSSLNDKKQCTDLAVNKCAEILKRVLRAGDVVCRYSENQFLVMLPTCQYETAMLVMKRIEKEFYSKEKTNKIVLNYSVDELD